MPDLDKPPLHTLPHDELLAKLKSLTNFRAVRDPEAPNGWRIELGPYEVVELLGDGGMREVYRARDPRLARDVASRCSPRVRVQLCMRLLVTLVRDETGMVVAECPAMRLTGRARSAVTRGCG
jgi:hypothetical protein